MREIPCLVFILLTSSITATAMPSKVSIGDKVYYLCKRVLALLIITQLCMGVSFDVVRAINLLSTYE